jgi:hypothetical protein
MKKKNKFVWTEILIEVRYDAVYSVENKPMIQSTLTLPSSGCNYKANKNSAWGR